jgi:hypothetical protein
MLALSGKFMMSGLRTMELVWLPLMSRMVKVPEFQVTKSLRASIPLLGGCAAPTTLPCSMVIWPVELPSKVTMTSARIDSKILTSISGRNLLRSPERMIFDIENS